MSIVDSLTRIQLQSEFRKSSMCQGHPKDGYFQDKLLLVRSSMDIQFDDDTKDIFHDGDTKDIFRSKVCHCRL